MRREAPVAPRSANLAVDSGPARVPYQHRALRRPTSLLKPARDGLGARPAVGRALQQLDSLAIGNILEEDCTTSGGSGSVYGLWMDCW